MCPHGWIVMFNLTTLNMAAKTFRFDDVCINADMGLINDITNFMLERFPGCTVIWGVSPLVHTMENYDTAIERQRVFPAIFNAYSDHRKFYNVDKAGIPKIHPQVSVAGHGIVHVDHRLLSFETQEMSILISCSLVNAKKFIPPFNKWDERTEQICKENEITLVKFEDGWRCMEYNTYNREQQLWYLHAREWTMEKIVDWFNK